MRSVALKKNKKKAKKKANAQGALSNGPMEVNGSREGQVADGEGEGEGEGEEEEEEQGTHKASDELPAQSDEDVVDDEDASVPPLTTSTTGPLPSDTTARLDAMQQERDSLRAEVTRLRQSLERLQDQHRDELSGVQEELQQSQQSKEHAETQYRNLLTKVTTIRSQLGERLKADAAELETARARIGELETWNRTASEESTRLQDQLSQLATSLESKCFEVESLRSRASISANNWAKERDDMLSRTAFLQEEYDVAKQAMQDWEILATEERSRREALEERIQEVEEQLLTQRDAYERVRNEAEIQSSTVDGLQRALRDLQEERKRELREMVEQSQTQLDTLRAQAKAADETAAEVKCQLEEAQKELARTSPFEKEVKEKNLLIGKLRHEAVILNDHLTKALRFLKRGNPEDNVDRQLVTNHFLHFLQLDRGDPKKFQVLGLIAALLGWNEVQKEQAGLLRQGSGFGGVGGSLRVPVSPFRRTPSTPTLGEFNPDSAGGGSRESLAELWSEFLEREAEAGRASRHSRRTSSVSNVTSRQGDMKSPSIGGIMSPTGEGGRSQFPHPTSPDLKRQESQGSSSKEPTK